MVRSSSSKLPWQLIACDLDGTLLGKEHKVNDADLAALQRAQAAGIRVVICTGRNALESAGVVGALGLTGPGVFVNGAVIADMATGKSLERTPIDPPVMDELIDFFGNLGHAVLLLTDDPETNLPVYIRTQHAMPHRATVEWMLANRMHALEQDPLEERYRQRVVRAGIVVDMTDALPIEQALIKKFGPRISSYSLYSPVYDCQVMDVFHPHVSKWTGIQAVCRQLGIDPTRAVAIGDDLNDLSMLQNATLSFAMANGPPAVHRAAKHVTLSQQESGVAHAIEGILAGKW